MEEIKIQTPKTEVAQGQKTVVRPLDSSQDNTKFKLTARALVMLLFIVLLGVATGYGVYAKKTAGTVRLGGQDVEIIKTASEEGVKDASTFKDTATGMVKENDGKITDEGTNILVRGDASQNVYMTSSVIDLSKYVGKKVQVWGETFQGQKAGWLMDVGRIKAL